MVRASIVLVFVVFAVDRVFVLENGLALTPPMGWMSWGYYMCGTDCDNHPEKCLDEDLILSVADAFYTEGYQEAGYEYIIIDDCWSEKTRDEEGRLVPDVTRFPKGMKYIADYIHNRGLKFGMYTNIADTTCMGYPGSKDHFKIDAETFASWDVDYLKVDGCFVTKEYLETAYIDFGLQLNRTGRPMVYSCSWPYYSEFIHHTKPNYSRIAQYCNLWRHYHDAVGTWRALRSALRRHARARASLAPHHRKGQWNDPDMLIFGTGALSPGQSRVHLSVYAMLSAPLLLSCDMNNITPYEKQLLQNMDLIAIAQDPNGVMARPFQLPDSITLWVKPHLPIKGDSYPSCSFLLVNLETENATVTFTPSQYGLNSTDGYSVMDVFTSQYLNNLTLKDSITVEVPFEDAVLYSLFPL